MKRVASLHLPTLPIDRLRRIEARSGGSPDLARPLVTSIRSGQRMGIAAVCARARALGLAPGMAVTQARSFIPDLEVRPAEPEGDRALLERLALLAARRWTPLAAVAAEGDGLLLDLSGTAHLFGGEATMAARILAVCRRLGLDARIAVAGTYGAAHALARFGRDKVRRCANGDELAAIAALPVAALRLDERAIASAHRFGIDCIGQLAAMPRGPLARRFGQGVIARLDQALGRVREPIDPIVPLEAPRAMLRLMEPVATAEAIAQVLGDLVAAMTDRLVRDGLAVRRMALLCDRVDGDVQRLVIGTARATRDPRHLKRLLAMRIEEVEPGFGIEAMTLVGERVEPLSPEQADALDDGGPGIHLPELIDRIAGRIGVAHVFHAGAVESDVPERSVKRVAPLGEVADWPRDWPRPVRLLGRPEPVDNVLAELPDQPPLRFRWRGRMHRVKRADGPERIHGEWWKSGREANSIRDYFQVEDEDGARFWLFRRGDSIDPLSGDLSWFIHGVFA